MAGGRSGWLLGALVAAVVVGPSCGGEGDAPDAGSAVVPMLAPSTGPASASSAPVSTEPVSTMPMATMSAATVPLSADDAAEAICFRTGTTSLGAVASEALDEASGVVASRDHPGVLWAHNDGDASTLFAVGTDGRDLGSIDVPVEGARDIEDIGLVAGPDGDDLLLADIGDNGATRDVIAVHRFSEPDPRAPAPISDVETLLFRYPDRPHNAEALLVDEANRRIVVVTKEQQPGDDGEPDEFGRTLPSFVFEGPLDGHDGTPVELVPAGTIDTLALEGRVGSPLPHPVSLLGFGGVVTGGDVSPDGSAIALRTYEAVWLWPRPPERSVAEALTRLDDFPCQVTSESERQGEAVAFSGDGLLTISEGVRPALHLLAQ